ncbi:hypothetical protein AGOR_G00031580 [Albula goreensis]|uniref:Ig-like domain-containing protein n=1 Tax=Albula goreensis TaxID=1534307 RepID=A0A8T3E399_9TELE|nr:hypothetical protein AGOR_G00031580 [Albula goreensis]
MEGRRFRLFTLLAGLVGAGVLQVSSMKVTVQEEVEAVNGTDVKLQCNFLSSSPISPSAVSVSWNFRPMQGAGEESVFYFQDKPYPPERGRFLGQVVWAGDIARGDASIMLHDVKFTFNGTFSCQVKNPPDVHGTAGELQLRVVQTASFSEIAILATAIGGAIGLVLIILAIFISVKFCRQRSLERELEMSSWDGKDTTVCDPEETLPLNRRQEENDSADDVISEASGRDLSSSEDEKRSLKVTAEITTDTETDTLPLKTLTPIQTTVKPTRFL